MKTEVAREPSSLDVSSIASLQPLDSISNVQSQISNLKLTGQSVINITDSTQPLNVKNGGDQQLASKRAVKWRLSLKNYSSVENKLQSSLERVKEAN
ncbi:MAG: hypothetical protein ABI180_17620 [Microcoleus sp.]